MSALYFLNKNLKANSSHKFDIFCEILSFKKKWGKWRQKWTKILTQCSGVGCRGKHNTIPPPLLPLKRGLHFNNMGKYLELIDFDWLTILPTSLQSSPNVPFARTTLSKEPDCVLADLKWNPGVPTLFATCLSDGTLAFLDCSAELKMIAILPKEHGSRASELIDDYSKARCEENKVIKCKSWKVLNPNKTFRKPL